MENKYLKSVNFNVLNLRTSLSCLAVGIIGLSLLFVGLAPLASAVDSNPPQQKITRQTCEDANDPKTCQAFETLNNVLSLMAAIILPLIVIIIIAGGIRYSMAGDNPEAIKGARSMLFKAALALISFLFLFAFLNWLVPGGALG